MANISLVTKKDSIISSFDDSLVFNTALGNDDRKQTRGVVLLGVLNQFALSTSSSDTTVSIDTGMGSLYGRQFTISEKKSFNLSALTGIKYCLIYAQVNTKNVTAQNAKLRLDFDAGGYPIPNNDDLTNHELGVSAMPLWRFIYTAGSSSPFSDVTCLFEGRYPGRSFRTMSLPGRATIFGNDVTAIKDGTNDYWTKSRISDVADCSKILGGHTFDNSLSADGDKKVWEVLDAVTIESDAHTTGADNVAGSCWWPSDSINYKLCETPSKGVASIIGFFVTMKFDIVYHYSGIFGINSHWEYRERNWKTSFFTRPKTFMLKYDDVDGTLKMMNPYWTWGENTAIPNLTVVLPSSLTYTTSSRGHTYYHYPEVAITCKGDLRFYGEIKLIPVISLK